MGQASRDPAPGQPGMAWKSFACIILVHLVHNYWFGETSALSVVPQSKAVLIFRPYLNFSSCGQKAENKHILWEHVLKMFELSSEHSHMLPLILIALVVRKKNGKTLLKHAL